MAGRGMRAGRALRRFSEWVSGKHPRGFHGWFVNTPDGRPERAARQAVVGTIERGAKAVPSTRGSAASRLAAAKQAPARPNSAYAAMQAAHARKPQQAAPRLAPDGAGGFKTAGTISRTDAAKVMFGDAGTRVAHWRDSDGQLRVGDVVKAGKTYADVKWRESGRTERIWPAEQPDVVFGTAVPSAAAPATAPRVQADITETQRQRAALMFGTRRPGETDQAWAKRVKARVADIRRYDQDRASSDAPASQVREAYNRLTSRPGGWVSLADIREHLAGMERRDVDGALESLAVQPGVQVIPWDNRKALSGRDRAAALRFGGEDNHAIRIEPIQVPPTSPPAKRTARAALKSTSASTGSSSPPAGRTIDALSRMSTRDEGRTYLAGATKAQLVDLAKQVSVPSPSRSTKDQLVEQIVASTIGGRASFAAMGDMYKTAVTTDSASRRLKAAAKPAIDAPAVANEISNLKTKAEILQRLGGLNVAELRKVATQFRIGIPATVKGRDAIRAYIADSHFGDRGRFTWR